MDRSPYVSDWNARISELVQKNRTFQLNQYHTLVEGVKDNPVLKSVVNLLFNEISRFEACLHMSWQDMKLLQIEKENVLVKLNKAEGKLHLKQYVKQLEDDAFPSSLLCGSYSTKTKWALSVEFQLTRTVKVLRNRLVASTIQPEMLVQTVLKVYDTFPGIVPDGEKIPPLNFLENNFDEILEEVGIYDEKEKVIIAALLEPIEEDDLESVTPNETESLLIYIKHLPTQLDENRTVETDAIMKQYFAEFQNEIKQTYFPTNDDGQFTNEVFVLFEPVRSDKVLEEFATSLLGGVALKKGETEAYARAYYVWI